MHNMVYLIGRLSTDIKENDSSIKLALTRQYKNENGEYETDFVDVKLFGAMLENTIKTQLSILKKGDLIGVKGRLQVENNQLIVIADKLSFLTSNKKIIEDESEE